MNYVHEDDQQYFADYGDGDIVVQANYPLGPKTVITRVRDWFEGFRPPENAGGKKRKKKRVRDKKNQVILMKCTLKCIFHSERLRETLAGGQREPAPRRWDSCNLLQRNLHLCF